MKVLLYQPTSDGVGKRFERIVASLVWQKGLEILRTVKSLSARIHQSRHDIAVAVLLAPTKEDLVDLHAIRDLFKDVRIVLVLPNSERQTISIGHELRPRFLTYIQSDFSDVTAVMEKMLQNIFSPAEGKHMGGGRLSPISKKTN